MLTSQQTGVQLPVHIWLTNNQTTLLGEMDAVRTATTLEPIHVLLSRRRESNEEAQEDQRALELQVGAHLDRGIRRKNRPNEDTLFMAQGFVHVSSCPPRPFALFIVADGMGGLTSGQEASQLAIGALIESVYTSIVSRPMLPNTLQDVLRAGIQFANQQLYRRNREQRTKMGTTITAALVSDTAVFVANVGDSRTYFSRPPIGLTQITRDHSLVAALVEAGVVKPEDIYTHPGRNQIYRCLGERPEVEVDTFVLPLTDGDLLLLCSDGLWEMVRDQQIDALLTGSTSSAQQLAESLVQAALTGGGDDNVGVIVVRVKRKGAANHE
jgi:serine/threonine protein phosphatase PrpC